MPNRTRHQSSLRKNNGFDPRPQTTGVGRVQRRHARRHARTHARTETAINIYITMKIKRYTSKEEQQQPNDELFSLGPLNVLGRAAHSDVADC